MEHNGADLMANELETYSYKDPVSPKCSPDGPLTQPWSPGSPSSSSLQGQIHEESEETVSTIEQVHISSIQGNLKVSQSQKHFFLKLHCPKRSKILDKILPQPHRAESLLSTKFHFQIHDTGSRKETIVRSWKEQLRYHSQKVGGAVKRLD